MSGISVTILVKNENFNIREFKKQIVLFNGGNNDELEWEFKVDKKLRVNNKVYELNDSFYIEILDKTENPGFPEDTWENVCNSTLDFNKLVEISCLSRNKNTKAYVLELIKQISLFDTILVINDKIDFFIEHTLLYEKILNEDTIVLLKPEMIFLMIEKSIHSIGTN